MQKLKEPKKPAQVEEIPASREQLELEAYFHWMDRGCPMDDPLTDWIEVEKKRNVNFVEEEEED